jgi:hypothetical protein
LAITDDFEAAEKESIDLLNVISKLPALMPLLVARIPDQACKDALLVLRDDFSTATNDGKLDKSSFPLVKQSICKVPLDCVGKVFEMGKKMVSGGGMIEKLAKQALDAKGLDLETLDVLMLAYLETLCTTPEGSQAEKDMLDEL